MKVGQHLEEVAKEDGFGFGRRADLRLAVDDFSRRMQAQNPALVLDPIIRKTRKIQANPGTLEERERAFRIRAGEQAFWDFQQRTARYVATWDRTYANRPRIDLASLETNYPPMEPPREDPTASPKRLMKIGGILMGAGLGTAALGGICYLIGASSTSLSGFDIPALILGVTVGPGLLVAGLIVLIIGGVWYAVRKPDEDAQKAEDAHLLDSRPPTPPPADPNQQPAPPPPDPGPPPGQL
jgi:hypothetical protein